MSAGGIETFKAMIALGLTDEQKLVLLEAMAADAKPRDPGAAVRMANMRARRKAGSVTRNVTPEPPNDIYSKPPASSEPKGSSEAKRVRAPLVVQVPDWMPAEAWLAFVAMRRAIPKVPFQDGAAKAVIGRIEKLRAEGHDPEKLLVKAVERGWRTVFPDEDTKGSSGVASEAWTAERMAEYRAKLASLDDDKPPGKPPDALIRRATHALRASSGRV